MDEYNTKIFYDPVVNGAMKHHTNKKSGTHGLFHKICRILKEFIFLCKPKSYDNYRELNWFKEHPLNRFDRRFSPKKRNIEQTLQDNESIGSIFEESVLNSPTTYQHARTHTKREAIKAELSAH